MIHKSLIVAILSSKAGVNRRERSRRAWCNQLKKSARVAVFFFAGGGGGEQAIAEQDVVTLDCSDAYFDVTRKSRKLLSYVLETYAFDHLFRCDDDTYVDPERLLAMEFGDYTGYDYGSFVGHGPYAHGGAGYCLSRSAAVIAESNMSLETREAEDMSIGDALHRSGMKLHHDERFRYMWEVTRLPRSGNDVITAHYVNSDERLAYLLEQRGARS